MRGAKCNLRVGKLKGFPDNCVRPAPLYGVLILRTVPPCAEIQCKFKAVAFFALVLSTKNSCRQIFADLLTCQGLLEVIITAASNWFLGCSDQTVTREYLFECE